MGSEEDPRLRLLEADWFRDKTVLDVGCGAGHMTMSVARRFDPAHILGVELDKQLVHAANQNIRHFLSHDLVVEERGRRGRRTVLSSPPRNEGGETENVKMENQEDNKAEKRGEERGEEEELVGKQVEKDDKRNDDEEVVMDQEHEQVEVMEKDSGEDVMEEFQQALSLLSFPLSFRVSRGPLSAPPLLLPPSSSSSRFPNNVTFIQVSHVALNIHNCLIKYTKVT